MIADHDTRIAAVRGRRLWDSRGQPALEVEVRLQCGATGRATAPSAALVAPGEAHDLRDGGAAFDGRDVARALAGVAQDIEPALRGVDATDQGAVDRALIARDGTADRHRLGGNAMLAASVAAAKAAAAARQLPLWRQLAPAGAPMPPSVPLPRVLLLDLGVGPGTAGDVLGVHAVPVGADDVAAALDWSAVVTRTLAAALSDRGAAAVQTTPRGGLRVGGLGGVEAIEAAARAVERAGFAAGEEMALAVEVRAWRFGRQGRYRIGDDGRETDTHGMIARYLGWLGRYPIVSLVDPLGIDEIAGMAALAAAAGRSVEVAVGDAVAGDARRVRRLADERAANGIVVKPGQAATLTELGAAVAEARAAGLGTVMAARPGVTDGGWLAHLAVAWGAGQLAAGGLARGERTGIWNDLLRVSDRGAGAHGGGAMRPRSEFPWG